ncbi:MAG: class I SAM-dependent methyltransferase [Eubacteriales bacterium]|nr:class I SAM-dependent methyltransferase [Eubacteriales bacterium]
MGQGRTEKIGSVTLDYTHYPEQDFYCDGASEDALLELVKTVPESGYPQEIRRACSWEVLYHLSDLRENIVEWLPMDRSMKVLEVGSGCGAITGSLARKAGSVTCVDLSKKRSLINAYRHRDCENVTIHVGNFTDIEPDLPQDYDYVCLIGVFEYGQSYIGGKAPFTDFYRIVKKHVKPGGRVVIAIENKLGLKYWAGCREDHVGQFFAGLEDYPDGGAARTFSRDGLEQLLRSCGEKECHFYYPYPDYKFMTMLYSDRYLPRVGELSNNLRNFDRDRMLLFDEKRVFDTLIREGLFSQYSNSFLVVTGPETETLYSRFSNDRAAQLCIRTDIAEKDGQRIVRKYPARPEAAGHIRTLEENGRLFSERFAGSGLSVNRLSLREGADGTPFAELEFLSGTRTLEELLDDCIQREDAAGFEQLFERYLGILSWKAGQGQRQDFDLIFPNICVRGQEWTMIDYEWTTDRLSPEDIARRALYCYGLENSRRLESPAVKAAMERLGLDRDRMAELQEQEIAFQRSVMREKNGEYRTALSDMRHLIGNRAVPWQEFFARADRKRVQVFEDFGEGYCPEHSYYRYDAYEADDLIVAKLVCRPGTKALRLDPAENPCLVRIRQVEWRGRALSMEELGRCLSTNGETLAENGERVSTVLFDTQDPNINIRLDALDDRETGGETLVIRAQIAWLDGEMLADLKARTEKTAHAKKTAHTARRKGFWFQR